MGSSTAISSENEFAKRDEMGLEKNPKQTSEAGCRAHYFKMLGFLICVQCPVVAYLAYFALRLVPGQADRIDGKFTFIREYDLGWVFVAVFVFYLTRAYMMINANGARAAARLDRPDQHIYKIMSKEKPFADAPYVLMANTGEAGRFNRAQRAIYNFDENSVWFMLSLVLVALVLGPLSLVFGLVQMCGRIQFANSYKQDKDTRASGFLICAIAEHVTASMVLLCALKTFIPALP